MSESPSPTPRATDSPLPRSVQRLPAGHRVLQVNVPQRLFDLAKAKALMDGKAWPEFVVELLKEATRELAAAKPNSNEPSS